MNGAQAVLARRRAERRALLERARRFADGLPAVLGVRAVIVIGSVARGDFTRASDIDVLVIAEHLPERVLDRFDALGVRPGLVQPVPWTPQEWQRERRRRNPMAVEARAAGVWLVGHPGASSLSKDSIAGDK